MSKYYYSQKMEKKQGCELIFLSFPSNFSAKCRWDMEETK